MYWVPFTITVSNSTLSWGETVLKYSALELISKLVCEFTIASAILLIGEISCKLNTVSVIWDALSPGTIDEESLPNLKILKGLSESWRSTDWVELNYSIHVFTLTLVGVLIVELLLSKLKKLLNDSLNNSHELLVPVCTPTST